MKTGRLIRIGLLFACSIIILFWGINFLKGKKLLKPEKFYYAKYTKISGLTESSPVTVNGFSVGKVRQISLTDFQNGTIMVKFVINYPNMEIPLGSQAKIISTDLMGTKAIEIVLSDSIGYYSNEDTLSGIIDRDLKDQVNAQMLPLKQSAEDLMSSMDSVLVALQLVFGPDNRGNLAQSFESVTQTIQNLEKTSLFLDEYVKNEAKKFSYILSNTDTIASGLKNRSTELHQIITNIAQLSDTLGQLPFSDMLAKLNIVLADLHQLFSSINQGVGTIGKLSRDDSLYMSLKSTTDNLNHLISDIRLNPKRYIHLSALDRGRTIITSNDSELLEAMQNKNDLKYLVCLVNTTSPLSEEDAIFKKFKNLKFIQIDNAYFYYVDETKNLNRGRKLVAKYISSYPDAGLYTWLNDKWHQIKF